MPSEKQQCQLCPSSQDVSFATVLGYVRHLMLVHVEDPEPDDVKKEDQPGPGLVKQRSARVRRKRIQVDDFAPNQLLAVARDEGVASVEQCPSVPPLNQIIKIRLRAAANGDVMWDWKLHPSFPRFSGNSGSVSYFLESSEGQLMRVYRQYKSCSVQKKASARLSLPKILYWSDPVKSKSSAPLSKGEMARVLVMHMSTSRVTGLNGEIFYRKTAYFTKNNRHLDYCFAYFGGLLSAAQRHISSTAEMAALSREVLSRLQKQVQFNPQ